MTDIEKQREHFDSIASQYHLARQNPNSLLYKSLLWAYVFSFAPPPSEGSVSVLEPMCGYAEGEDIVSKHYCQNLSYTGFDYSQELVDIVKKKHPEKNIYHQDVTTFRPQARYDIIMVIGGLHHVPNYALDVLARLRDGLNDDGILINFEPTHSNGIAKSIRERIYRSNPIFDPATERDFSVTELNGLYGGAGLHVAHQFHLGLLTHVLYYNPDAFPKLAKVSPIVLKALFPLEKPFYRTRLAKFFSFATLSILKKN